jgi:multidrug efflux pump
VVVVMYLFLQNIRATLIPALAVPVVLLGTFGVLALFGYSINTLTLFAMVLAIGLVDDAIVVVENVERIMRDEGLPARSHRKIDGRNLRRWSPLRWCCRCSCRWPSSAAPPGLSSVLGHHYFGDDPLGGGGADPDAGAARL